jgi:hypothetical protein
MLVWISITLFQIGLVIGLAQIDQVAPCSCALTARLVETSKAINVSLMYLLIARPYNARGRATATPLARLLSNIIAGRPSGAILTPYPFRSGAGERAAGLAIKLLSFAQPLAARKYSTCKYLFRLEP